MCDDVLLLVQEIDDLVRAADADEDGLISFDEFRRIMGR